MSEWLDIRDAEPPLDGDDYGAWIESREVLAVARGRVHIARLARDRRDDGPGLEPGRRWVLQGRDGYYLEGVTHWQALPEPPEVTR